MFRYSVIALSVMVASNSCFAEAYSIAMLTPVSPPQDLTLVNGERLAFSRYANIINPSAESVTVSFNGVNEVVLSAKFSLDSVQFSDNVQFGEFLKNAGVKENYIKDILLQNSGSGFAHSSLCKGARSECIITTQGIDFVVDYYNQTVRIFISPDYLNQSKGDVTFLSPNGDFGMVNNLSVFYYDSLNELPPSYLIRNQGSVGSGFSTLRYSLYTSDVENHVDDMFLNQALSNGSKILVGRSQVSSQFNSSSQQSLFSDMSLTGVRMGNAEELVDQSYGKKTISYYSPVNGTLEVNKGGQVVYAVATQAGYSELNISGLPPGQYNALLVIKSASGDVISTQNINVNNTGYFNTGFGWHVFGGRSNSGTNYISQMADDVIEAGLQFPINAFTAGAAGIGVIKNNNVFSSGLVFRNEGVSLSAKAGAGNNQFRYYDINAYRDNISLTYRKMVNGKEWTYGDASSTSSLSLNYNFSFSSDLTLNVGYLRSAGEFIKYREQPENAFFNNMPYIKNRNKYSSNNIYANAFYNFRNGNSFYVNASKDTGADSFTVSLGVSVPLFNNVRVNNSTTYNQNRKIENNTTADYTATLSDKWSNTISAGTSHSETPYSSLMYNLYHHSESAKGSGYIYSTNKGNKTASLSFDSTQIINRDGVSLTSSGWDNAGFITRSNVAGYDVSVKNMSDGSTRYYDKKTHVISVPAYSKIMVTSNTDSPDLIFADGKSNVIDVLVMSPGSTFSLNKKTIVTQSVIVTLRNQNNEFASSAQCKSHSCLSVSRLSKGVFRVKYTGDGFSLNSQNEYCESSEAITEKFINIICRNP